MIRNDIETIHLIEPLKATWLVDKKIILPVGQNKNISGSPKYWKISLVIDTWACAKELNTSLSAGHML